MKRVNYKVVFLWILHSICVALMMGGLWTIYRNASNDNFRNALMMAPFESTRSFERTVLNNIDQVVDYVQLEEKFETNGHLDLKKTVETDKDDQGVKRKYSLQDALDFGQAIGVVFNSENRLIILKNQVADSPKEDEEVFHENDDAMEEIPMNTLESKVSSEVFNYENYEELLAGQESDHSRENNILLSLLYRLSEYYEYRRRLGLRDGEDTNFFYRLVYIDKKGHTIISTNREEQLDSDSLQQYGAYYWYDSKTDMLRTTGSADLHRAVQVRFGEKEAFQQGVYELMAAVDTNYPMMDAFDKGKIQYQNYANRIRLLLALSGLLVLGLLISFIAILQQDEDRLTRFDRWYSETVFFAILLLLILIYWGVKEILFAFRTRYSMDLVTGIVLILLGYFPLLYCFISVFRRIRSQVLISGLLTVHMMSYVELNMRQRKGNVNGFQSVTLRLGFQIVNVAFVVAVVLALQTDYLLLKACVILMFFLWNLIYLGLSCRNDIQQQRIFKRITDMAEGNLGEKLDTSNLSAENRTLANMVNALDDSLEKAVQSRTRSERMQTELIANVSHDLRTPLTSILSYVDLLKREPLPEGRSREYLKVLESKAYRLKSLAEALMDASRATSGTLTINWIDIDMVQMLNQVVGEFYDRFEDQRLEAVIHMVEPPAMIRADGKLLWRIFENLFSNVCKYAMPGTRVYIDLQETTQSFVFTIKNISARKLTQSAENLMERFIRGDVARTTEGSGLGLSIVKNMTEQLHGKFELFLDGDYFRARLIFPKLGMRE